MSTAAGLLAPVGPSCPLCTLLCAPGGGWPAWIHSSALRLLAELGPQEPGQQTGRRKESQARGERRRVSSTPSAVSPSAFFVCRLQELAPHACTGPVRPGWSAVSDPRACQAPCMKLSSDDPNLSVLLLPA